MKVWFLLMFKSSFSPIDKSTCKGKSYFHTSWPELFIFEDLLYAQIIQALDFAAEPDAVRPGGGRVCIV